MDLEVTQTLQNFTTINFIISHVGGSFPSIIDRFENFFTPIKATAGALYGRFIILGE
jgi:hypothetical protein